ncbi:hypothetical protein EDC01DRAFT_753424 [Geopyxis carbonaria]|nr:hypothetical protein EDC01DRAFT_753424 [Geopyxis carbonaria]
MPSHSAPDKYHHRSQFTPPAGFSRLIDLAQHLSAIEYVAQTPTDSAQAMPETTGDAQSPSSAGSESPAEPSNTGSGEATYIDCRRIQYSQLSPTPWELDFSTPRQICLEAERQLQNSVHKLGEKVANQHCPRFLDSRIPQGLITMYRLYPEDVNNDYDQKVTVIPPPKELAAQPHWKVCKNSKGVRVINVQDGGKLNKDSSDKENMRKEVTLSEKRLSIPTYNNDVGDWI